MHFYFKQRLAEEAELKKVAASSSTTSADAEKDAARLAKLKLLQARTSQSRSPMSSKLPISTAAKKVDEKSASKKKMTKWDDSETTREEATNLDVGRSMSGPLSDEDRMKSELLRVSFVFEQSQKFVNSIFFPS